MIMLDILDHRPFEEQLPSLVVAAEPALDLVARRGSTDPEVAVAVRPKRIAQPLLHVAEGPPALQVRRRQAADLLLAQFVVVPELDAGAVVERNEHPGLGRQPLEAVVDHLQLVDDAGMEQPDQVGARRDAIARPDLDRACRHRRRAGVPRAPAPASPPAPGRPRRSVRCGPRRRRSRPTARRPGRGSKAETASIPRWPRRGTRPCSCPRHRSSVARRMPAY